MTWKQTFNTAWANRHTKGLFYRLHEAANNIALLLMWLGLITMPAWADYVQF